MHAAIEVSGIREAEFEILRENCRVCEHGLHLSSILEEMHSQLVAPENARKGVR